MQQDINIENLWNNIHNKLYAYISKSVKSKDDVNDIIQDTFIKVKTKIDNLKNPAKAESWIFQIARNTTTDFFRAKKKTFQNTNDTNEAFIESDVFNNDDKIIEFQTQSFSDYAGFVVKELPEKYREAVYLADILGLSMKEIANKQDISVSAAKSRVQRGRKMIKEIILKCCDVNTDKYGNILDYQPNNCDNKDNC